ncbi:MAG: hypothetical protein ACYC7E_19535 [Armatimonadota bacterium]
MEPAAPPASVEQVDPRSHVRAETASPALEPRLASQFALSNGCLGLRGTHEEMPTWASPASTWPAATAPPRASWCPSMRWIISWLTRSAPAPSITAQGSVFELHPGEERSVL